MFVLGFYCPIAGAADGHFRCLPSTNICRKCHELFYQIHIKQVFDVCLSPQTLSTKYSVVLMRWVAVFMHRPFHQRLLQYNTHKYLFLTVLPVLLLYSRFVLVYGFHCLRTVELNGPRCVVGSISDNARYILLRLKQLANP